MSLSWSQSDFLVMATWSIWIDVGTIEQNIVTLWRSSSTMGNDFSNGVCGSIIPIRDWKDTKIKVIRERSRTVNEDRTSDTIGILNSSV